MELTKRHVDTLDVFMGKHSLVMGLPEAEKHLISDIGQIMSPRHVMQDFLAKVCVGDSPVNGERQVEKDVPAMSSWNLAMHSMFLELDPKARNTHRQPKQAAGGRGGGGRIVVVCQ